MKVSIDYKPWCRFVEVKVDGIVPPGVVYADSDAGFAIVIDDEITARGAVFTKRLYGHVEIALQADAPPAIVEMFEAARDGRPQPYEPGAITMQGTPAAAPPIQIRLTTTAFDPDELRVKILSGNIARLAAVYGVASGTGQSINNAETPARDTPFPHDLIALTDEAALHHLIEWRNKSQSASELYDRMRKAGVCLARRRW